jgi:hypothetical protein
MMDRFESKTIKTRVYADPELRATMRSALEDFEARQAAAIAAATERERSRPERLKAFWESLGLPEFYATPEQREARRRRDRLLALPAAEAWIAEHPEEFNFQTTAELQRSARVELSRLKASRERLMQIGVK